MWLTDDIKVGFSAEWSKIYGHTLQHFSWTGGACRKRHVYEHTAALQAARHTSNQLWVGGWRGGNKMFTTGVDDWILISHSTFTRCTSLPQRRPHASGNGTLLLKMTRCQTLRTDTPSSPLCSTFNFYWMHSVTHCDTWWRRQVAFYKSNATLTTLNMSTYQITIKMPQLPVIKP